ncbi:hypothetical protein L249_1120 [Ophiocordyceps polyrhachis-furcata BCC 54312]|uniref:Uncharacterized protein n=1 Tax=Ophiocordyceps polyrhachis-furcata BCC 54312 TaxID=1330021 RepID=A0A367LDA5_9HYPO|nr:hypothetical protein L249_1120 [Ophiocordyceps polyrhachis-furcata BCC 54312]
MKPTSLLSAAALTSLASAIGYERFVRQGKDNLIAGKRLFPGNVIAGYNSDYRNHTSESWAQYVLDECKNKFADSCDSTISYSAINSGTPKDRFWFGYVFRGGKTTLSDYTQADGVRDSIIYVVTDKDEQN